MKENKLIIRIADIKDSAILYNLDLELEKYESKFAIIRNNPKRKETFKIFRNRFRKDLKKRGFRFFIAEYKGNPVGFTVAQIEKNPVFPKYTKRGHIGPTFIKKEYRNKNIGSKLLKEALNWFKSKKIKLVQVSIIAKNNNALKFWRKKGFKDYSMRMNLILK